MNYKTGQQLYDEAQGDGLWNWHMVSLTEQLAWATFALKEALEKRLSENPLDGVANSIYKEHFAD